MQDRYLYKAKREDDGEWVIGLLSYPQSIDTERGVESYYFFAINKKEAYCQCVVSADTICQCTGVKDKNGKLIWENDIVLIPGDDEKQLLIAWHNFLTRYCIVQDDIYVGDIDAFWCEDVEVIGNKFDNPELLNRLEWEAQEKKECGDMIEIESVVNYLGYMAGKGNTHITLTEKDLLNNARTYLDDYRFILEETGNGVEYCDIERKIKESKHWEYEAKKAVAVLGEMKLKEGKRLKPGEKVYLKDGTETRVIKIVTEEFAEEEHRIYYTPLLVFAGEDIGTLVFKEREEEENE